MPTTAEILGLALKYHQAGQLPQAEQLYRQILQSNPRHADALHLLGVLISHSGRHDLAVAYIEQALAVKPRVAAFHNNLGYSYQALGRLDEAAAQYRMAVQAEPGYAIAFNNMGNVCRAQQKPKDAAYNYRQALRFQPDYAEAHNNLGVALQELGLLEEAVASHRQALRLKPDFVDGYSNLGVALQSQGKFDEALANLGQALRLEPNNAEVYSNMGNLYKETGQLDLAVASYRKAVAVRPDYAEAHNNLGFALEGQGNFDDASASYETALRLKPDFPGARWNRSLFWLLRGDFERGWSEYEWRWSQPSFTKRNLPQPVWDGSDLAGRTILLYGEQGFGDMLQFIRYVPQVVQRGGKVVVECHPPLCRVLANVSGVERTVAMGSPLGQFDVQLAMASLPLVFRTTLGSVPSPIPYLQVDAALLAKWREQLQPVRGFKVGICWQGNPTFRADRQRSVPLGLFARLAQVEGVALVSLQKGHGTEQLRALAGKFPVHDLGPGFDEGTGAAFMDTAAVMKNLDLVISSDTAVPHLAGTLGIPVWVALALVPDWRWLLGRDDCPWYPSMRMFRQTRFGDWEGVFKRMGEALAEVVARQLIGRTGKP